MSPIESLPADSADRLDEAAEAPAALPAVRKPYAAPTLTEQGDLADVTAGAFGDFSP